MDLVSSQPVSSPLISANDKCSEPSTATTVQGKFEGRTVHVDSNNQSPNYIKTSEANASNPDEDDCGACCSITVTCCEIVFRLLEAI